MAYHSFLLPINSPTEGCKQIASVSDAIIAYAASREALGDYRRRRDALQRHRRSSRAGDAPIQCPQSRNDQSRSTRTITLGKGQMIYAYIHDITPSMSSLVVEGQTIILTPHVPPSLQAQERFKHYDKAKSALAGLPERIQKASDELAGIDETLTFLNLAKSFEAIESGGHQRPQRRLGTSRRRPPPSPRQTIATIAL
jgi:hypothetical protein